jgi:hypothetical protein
MNRTGGQEKAQEKTRKNFKKGVDKTGFFCIIISVHRGN